MLVAAIIIIGMILRIGAATSKTLWVDEAESAINALTILESGVPTWSYQELPLYENTLVDRWEDHNEYEFRDSSYSKVGVAVYHGWLPLYAIAASHWLFGIQPDSRQDPPAVIHGVEDVFRRTVVPRLPAILFSLATMIAIFLIGRGIAGYRAGIVALIWMAVADKTVYLGSQARYYSLTLLMSTLVAACLWRAVYSGAWRAFLALGACEGILFHTHQLSSVVFAAAATTTLPLLIRHRQGLQKCCAASGIALAMTVPWVIGTGFSRIVSEVPKVFRLFDSWKDWVTYVISNPGPLVLMLLLGFLVLILRLVSRTRTQWLWKAIARAAVSADQHFPVYVFLTVWMLLIYGAFHTLIPAASYFENRLTLMLMVPYILLLSTLIADLSLVVPRQYSLAVASFAAMLSLISVHRVGLPGPSVPDFAKAGIGSVISTLAPLDFPAGTRFYASPNEHLVFSYYTGLPVQSIAPIRARFLDAYPGTIVFLKKYRSLPFLPANELVLEPEFAGMDRSSDERLQKRVWEYLIAEKLQNGGMPVPQTFPLPEAAAPMVARYRAYYNRVAARQQEYFKSVPIFSNVKVSDPENMLDVFFVRFVGYAQRLGKQANIYNRLLRSRPILIPEASSVAFICDTPSDTYDAGSEASKPHNR